MSLLKVNEIRDRVGTGSPNFPNGLKLNNVELLQSGVFPYSMMPPGSILQVVPVAKTDTFTTSSAGTFLDITGLTATITPKSATSKILILCTISAVVSSGYNMFFRITRNSTPIGLGDAAGSRDRASSGTDRTTDIASTPTYPLNFEDSPSTSSPVTYQVQLIIQGSTAYINRSVDDLDESGRGRMISTIILMEVGA